jgi:hypothetical protein
LERNGWFKCVSIDYLRQQLNVPLQKWRSSVKARTFVLCLLDYYIDQSAHQSIVSTTTAAPDKITEPHAEAKPQVNGSVDIITAADSKAPETPVPIANSTAEMARSTDVPIGVAVKVKASENVVLAEPTKPIKDELVHDPNDDWCIQYLSVFNVPATIEAFDDDASGYVKIKEVNEFTDGIPPTWTLTQWLAYWSAGESLLYNVYSGV